MLDTRRGISPGTIEEAVAIPYQTLDCVTARAMQRESMIDRAIRFLKTAVLLAIGKLGYAVIKLPKEPIIEVKPLAADERRPRPAPIELPKEPIIEVKPLAADECRPQPSPKLAGTPKIELEKAKQKAFDHATRCCGGDPGLDFLEPFKTFVNQQHQYRQELKKDQSVIRIIGESWLGNIGQIAHLDIYFKLKALKMLEPSETVICFDGVTPANQSLLSYYAPFANRIVPDRAALGVTAELMELLEESTVTVRLIDGRAEIYHSLFYDVGVAWQQQARPPLVSLRPAHRAKGRRWLSSLGLPDEGWFVTFHCRTTANHQDLRSVRTETYYTRDGGSGTCRRMGGLHGVRLPI